MLGTNLAPHILSVALLVADKAIIRPVRIWFLISAALALTTPALGAETRLAEGVTADRVVVVKKDRTLTLMQQGKELKTYKVALGGEPAGAKTRQGDHKTPEGTYILDRRNARSKFYRSIHISYPNQQDREQAGKLGVSAGGDVFLHGLPNGFGWIGRWHLLRDWTDGCVAVTDEEMDEIWHAVPDGTVIEIKP